MMSVAQWLNTCRASDTVSPRMMSNMAKRWMPLPAFWGERRRQNFCHTSFPLSWLILMLYKPLGLQTSAAKKEKRGG